MSDGQTRRQRIADYLAEGAITLPELAELLGMRVKDVADDLEHLRRSWKGRLVIEPAECPGCGERFRDRTRFTRPSRCPRCKGERVTWPRIRLEP